MNKQQRSRKQGSMAHRTAKVTGVPKTVTEHQAANPRTHSGDSKENANRNESPTQKGQLLSTTELEIYAGMGSSAFGGNEDQTPVR